MMLQAIRVVGYNSPLLWNLVKMVKGNEDLGTKLSDDLINLEKQESIKNLMLSLKVQDMPPTLAVV